MRQSMDLDDEYPIMDAVTELALNHGGPEAQRILASRSFIDDTSTTDEISGPISLGRGAIYHNPVRPLA